MHDLEHSPHGLFVRTQSPRAVNGLGDIRDVAATPDANFVAEDAKAARPPAANGALGDDPALAATPVVDRRLLDYVSALRQLQLQRGVVEIARRSSLQSCRHRLVDAAVQPDEVAARPQRQPVEVHRGVSTIQHHVASIAAASVSRPACPPGHRLPPMSASLAEDFLPVYDVSDAVAVVVEADREAAWQALLDVDLLKVGREAPLVGMLGALRMLPEVVGHLLHGERPAKPPESMRVRNMPSIPMKEGGWILLDERPGEEIALGLVGKFWRPVIDWAGVRTADEFRAFDEPGFAKTVYDLSVRELDSNRTLLSGLMRTATTDEHARRWFRRCWTFGAGSGAHVLVGALLDSARRTAEGCAEE